METKKTALDLACEELSKLISCDRTPGFYQLSEFVDVSIANEYKKHFQQKAEIKDGWDVVKNMYDQLTKYQSCCKKRAELHPNKQVKHDVSIEVCILDNVLEMMKHHLIFAGLEVDDE